MFFKKKLGLVQLRDKFIEKSNQVRVVPIGRGHAGKTNLINGIPRVLDTLPSGIRLGYNDLKLLNEALGQVRRTEQDLLRGGLPPTLERSYRTVGLFFEELEQLTLQISDEIGQPITNTTPDSPKEQIQRFDEYVNAASKADVLWVATSLPLTDSSQSIGLFRDDLARYQCWLSDAIQKRSAKNPVAVAIVVTKLDALFCSEEEASRQMTDSWLTEETLKPLVDVVRQGKKCGSVSKGTVVPVSAFGFGNSKRTHKVSEASTAYEDLEEEFVLEADAGLNPFNVLTLMVWSFYAATTKQPGQSFRKLEEALATDLRATGHWWVEI
jgi:hypothetical protein